MLVLWFLGVLRKRLLSPGAVTKLLWKVLGDALLTVDNKVNCPALTLFEHFRMRLPHKVSGFSILRGWIARRNEIQASG